MIGLLYLVFFAVYGLVSVVVINKFYGFTKSRYNKGWVGGWLAALLMYNLVFWDWIPVYVMHKYYCSTEAGFWVYKSPEQWIKENPDMVGQKWGDDYIRPIERFSDNNFRIWYSRSVYEETIIQPEYSYGLLRKVEDVLVDARTGKALSRTVQFSKINANALPVGNGTLRDLKFWLAIGGNVCTNKLGQSYNVLAAKNGKHLFKLGMGEDNVSKY